MRTKVVLLCLCAGVVGLAAVICAKHQSSKLPGEVPAAPVAKSVSAAAATNTTANAMATDTQAVTEPSPAPEVVTSPVAANSAEVEVANASDQHAAAVQEKVSKLQEWEANADAQSLKNILAELTDSDKEVRSAAIAAAVQFDSRDAIPVLKATADKTTDSAEKKALLDAAEFIALPSITEVRALKDQQLQPTQPPPQADPQPTTELPPPQTPADQPPQ